MRFVKLKNDILGKEYSLSIAYVSERKSRELNKKYRKKDKSTNILSFSLYKDMGELVLCKSVIKREAETQSQTFENWLGYLVIHGMLHLKGMEHSSKMEAQEKKYGEKYFYRHRRGHNHDKNSSGRIRKGRKRS